MGKGQAIAGFVLSIVGIVLSFFGGLLSIISLPAAIIGLILSVNGGKKLAANEQPRGLATAGLVLGIIATVITGISFLTCGLCIICASSTGSFIDSIL